MATKEKKILLNVDKETYEKIKQESDKFGLSMSSYVLFLIKQYNVNVTLNRKTI